MADEETKFEEFKELVEELSEVRGKLLKLEDRKSSVREVIYEKVKADYEAKVKAVERKIEKKGEYIEEVFNSCRSEIGDLVNQRNRVEEEIEELSLRHYLGEFEEEEHERLYQDKKDLLQSLTQKLEDSTVRIDFLKQFLPEAVLKTLPEEKVGISRKEAPGESAEVPTEAPPEAPAEPAEPPAEAIEESTEAAVESPAESPAEPVETFAGSLEVAETDELVEEVVSEEEADKEKAPVDTGEFATEEIAVKPGDKTAEQPTDMLSEEEVDALIEEKISPVTESEDIIKQPELAPEAQEKEAVECPKCGMMNEPESWYCEKCGTELLAEGTG